MECYDISEDIDGNEIDGKKIFRDMLEELRRAGARISPFASGAEGSRQLRKRPISAGAFL